MQAFVIQSRLGSTRMPGKILLPFSNGKNILEIMVNILQKNFPDLPIIIATTTNTKDEPIVSFAKEHDLQIFRGDENNVLKRTVDAANHFGVTDIIRICSDNPFLHPMFVSALIEDKSAADYVSYQVDGLPTIRTHYGLFAERVQLSALERAVEDQPDPFFLEHVTNYIYGNPDKFECNWLNIEDHLLGLENLRLTIDDPIDFKLAGEIYEAIVKDGQFSLSELKDYLNSHVSVKEAMSQNKEKYSK
ncbi:MAG: glycosyl transferase family 2 [Flavobacteriales bacterium]|nr:glycosyl transferase family 2 [Flavobacteriales bacterium]